MSFVLLWALSLTKALLFLLQVLPDEEIETASNAVLKIGVGASLAFAGLYLFYLTINAFRENSKADNQAINTLADVLKTVAGPLETGIKSLEETFKQSAAVQAALLSELTGAKTKITDLEGSSAVNKVLIEKHDEFAQNAVNDIKSAQKETLELVKLIPGHFNEVKQIQQETNKALDDLKKTVIEQIELVRKDVNEKCESAIQHTDSLSAAS